MTVELPVRQRRRAPKVKSGCHTCKARRVKCDEAKPHCRRCTSTGWKCDGYTRSFLTQDLEHIQVLALAKRISICIPGTTEEKRGFSYFLNNTAAEMSGYFDTSFWQELLLQGAAVEPALRHAVIGLGTLHESFANKQLDYSPDHIERGFAIKQYTKAIGHLRKSLATGKQEPVAALMSCMLFVCFDSIRGHFGSSMVHLQSGLRILRDLDTSSVADQHIITKILAPAFKRLSVQSILYIDTIGTAARGAFASDLLEFDIPDTKMPDTFETLEEARNFLNQAANGLFRVFYLHDPDLPHSSQSQMAGYQYEKYADQVAAWGSVFGNFMSSRSEKLNTKELRGAALLKIQHTAATIMATSLRPDPHDPRPLAKVVNAPNKLRSFLPEFQTIVNLSRSLVTAAEADARSGKPPLTFSTDLGIIGPLFFCCLKCPHESVRAAALELITKCQRREGMWDSATIARLLRAYRMLGSQHRAQEEGCEGGFSPEEPINEFFDLVFRDGMKWEWRLKDSTRRYGNTMPGYSWTDVG